MMYLFIGYDFMYSGASGWIPGLDLDFGLGSENTVDDVLASGGDTYYAGFSDFFFQGRIRSDGHVDHLRCGCGAN